MDQRRDVKSARLVPHTLNFPYDLSQKIRQMAAASGATMTQIVVDGVEDFLNRAAAHALDERFSFRLDQLSRGNERIEREVAFVAEALAAFIQHQLTLVAHQPPFEAETAKLGRMRYEAFVEFVSKRMARSKRLAQYDTRPTG